jgi:hypothetical protein
MEINHRAEQLINRGTNEAEQYAEDQQAAAVNSAKKRAQRVAKSPKKKGRKRTKLAKLRGKSMTAAQLRKIKKKKKKKKSNRKSMGKLPSLNPRANRVKDESKGNFNFLS